MKQRQTRLWNPNVRDQGRTCATCGQGPEKHRKIGVFPVYCPEMIR